MDVPHTRTLKGDGVATLKHLFVAKIWPSLQSRTQELEANEDVMACEAENGIPWPSTNNAAPKYSNW